MSFGVIITIVCGITVLSLIYLSVSEYRQENKEYNKFNAQCIVGAKLCYVDKMDQNPFTQMSFTAIIINRVGDYIQIKYSDGSIDSDHIKTYFNRQWKLIETV